MHALFFLALPSVLVAFQDAAKPSSYSDQLANVAKTYQIAVDYEAPSFPARTQWGPVEGRKAERKNLDRYAPLFVREFTLLPPALIAKAKLKKVVLCEDLAFMGQRRNAIPDWGNDILFFDVARGSYAPRYLATVIHHEFFHLVDYRDDGQVYKDDAWAALNDKGFKYGNGGKDWQADKSTAAFTDKYPGFLTHYGTTGVEEDKAELFAHLIVNPAHVKERCKDDAVLRAKVARMNNLLADFCPEVNEAFWKKVEKVERAGM